MSQPPASETSQSSAYWRGFRLGVPVFVASSPFGLLFGALAVQNGMSISEAVLTSAIIYAGASQMVGIELFGGHIAPWLVVFSIFAVNFRHVLYSAALGPRIAHWSFAQKALGFFVLTDPQYAESERLAEAGKPVGFVWYMGIATPIYVFWVFSSWLGAYFGTMLPDTHALGLDFLLPIYFLALVMGFRKRPLWLPVVATSAVASVIAYKTVGSPWHVSIGAVVGILLAAFIARPDAAGIEKP